MSILLLGSGLGSGFPVARSIQTRTRGAASIAAAIDRRKTTPPPPPKLSEAMAGPGQSPASAQPAPNSTEPITRFGPTSRAGGGGNEPPITGPRRRAATRQATAIGMIAPPITKASVGSQSPNTSSHP